MAKEGGERVDFIIGCSTLPDPPLSLIITTLACFGLIMFFCNYPLAFPYFSSQLPVLGNDNVTPDAPSALSLAPRIPPRRSVVILLPQLGRWRKASLAGGTWPLTALGVRNRNRRSTISKVPSDLDSKL